MRRLIAAALLAGTAIATPATAAPLFFDFVAVDPAQSLSFNLDSNPFPRFVSAEAFFYTGVEVPSQGVNALLAFYFDSAGGGLEVYDEITGNLISATKGDQLFSGGVYSTVFSPGTFALTGSQGYASGTLTITAATAAVPEPATWAMMIAGFGAVGYAMRRRQKITAKVRFA